MSQQGDSAESRLGLPPFRPHGIWERTAFALLILFVGAAAVGAFGDGPASDAVADSSDGKLRVEYQRFCRRTAPQVIDITLPTEPGSKQIEVTLNRDYLQRTQIVEVRPQPMEVTTQGNGRMRFATDGSGEPMTVHLHIEAQDAGFQQAVISVPRHGEIRFKQLVYP
jgi:hypothetical protein